MIESSRFLRFHSENPLSGPDVLKLHSILIQLGYLENNHLTAEFDVTTEAALIAFQSDHQLLEDGTVGPLTWKSLYFAANQLDTPLLEANSDSISIKVDLKRKNLTLVDALGEHIFPVGIGKPSTPSPIGSWQIIQKAMNPGGAFGSRWMRLNVPWGHYGIHGTNNPKSIGRAYSHGCIRLHNADIESFYDRIPIGTSVAITGPLPKKHSMKPGARGADVAELQTMLSALGYYEGAIDGIYGKGTTQAVKTFQSKHRLPVTGRTNNKTYNRILSNYEKLQGDQEP